MDSLPIHPAAQVLPLMVGAEFDALALDIKAHGQREPIILHPDGSILDGRNRYRACQRVGVEPVFETWAGEPGTEVEFVISANIHRRHLDASQRAMYAATLANTKWGRPLNEKANQGVITNAQAAEMMDVSERTVERARAILNSGDESLISAVASGEQKVTPAAKQIKDENKAKGGRTSGAGHRERMVYWRSFSDAVAGLSALPDPKEVARHVPAHAREMLRRKLEYAVKWLNDFNEAWSEYNVSRSADAKDEDAA